MARIHILRAVATNVYQCVVHENTPAGNNAAGFAWSAILVAAGLNQSLLSAGTGPGQTTQAELDAIKAGTMLEGIFTYNDNPALTDVQRQAAVDAAATACLAQLEASISATYGLFGYTRT